MSYKLSITLSFPFIKSSMPLSPQSKNIASNTKLNLESIYFFASYSSKIAMTPSPVF